MNALFKTSLSIVLILCFCTSIIAFERGILETEDYKVPYVHGDNNFDSMKGLGYLMGWYAPKDLYKFYVQAWGLDAKYNEGAYPTNPDYWYKKQTDGGMDPKGWNDYTVALLELRSLAQYTYSILMNPNEKLLLSNFCDGINEAIQKLKSEQREWYYDEEEGLVRYEEDFPNGIEPKHFIAYYLHTFIYSSYKGFVYGLFPDFGPSHEEDDFIFDNPDYFLMGSQMWSFIDDSGVPWVQMDTHLNYRDVSKYRPFLCQVTTEPVPYEVGFNYFGWNIFGLPFVGSGVRFPNADEGLDPLAWGFTAHYNDPVDVYKLNCKEDSGRLYYEWMEGRWVPLTAREPIIIEYEDNNGNPKYLCIDEVYETPHHGPVVTFDTREAGVPKTIVYASRGCWDVDTSLLNFIKQRSEMLKAANIEEFVEVMNNNKCLPAGNYLIVNGNGDLNPQGEEPVMMRYILGGPRPDRRECISFEGTKENWEFWSRYFLEEKACIDPYGKVQSDVFQHLYDMYDLPQDHNKQGEVEYFVNCNSSINHNNPFSGGPTGALNMQANIDAHGRVLVYGDWPTFRQLRAQALVGREQFEVDEDHMLGGLLFDKCHNRAMILIDDLVDVCANYLGSSQITQAERDKINAAMPLLTSWAEGADEDISAILDNAPASKESIKMLLYKLWECYFITHVCKEDFSIYNRIFRSPIPDYRETILSMGEDFCLDTLRYIAVAYDNWVDFETHHLGQAWGNHFRIVRDLGYTDYTFNTDGDSKVLRSNLPWPPNWYNLLKTGIIYAGAGQSSPMLARLDPDYLTPDNFKIWYFRAVDSCLDPDMIWDDGNIPNQTVFDPSCPSTNSWTQEIPGMILEW